MPEACRRREIARIACPAARFYPPYKAGVQIGASMRPTISISQTIGFSGSARSPPSRSGATAGMSIDTTPQPAGLPPIMSPL